MTGGVTMGWMWIWPALCVAGLLILGFVAVRPVQNRRISSSDAGPSSDSPARRILDTRYARGPLGQPEVMASSSGVLDVRLTAAPTVQLPRSFQSFRRGV